MVSKNSQIAVLSNSIDRTFWDTFSELALKRNDISERIPIVTYADTMKLNTIYERLKDSLYISSMNCPYATVSMNLSKLYDLYDYDCERCPDVEDLPELPDSLTANLQKSFETPQIQQLMRHYAAAQTVLARETEDKERELDELSKEFDENHMYNLVYTDDIKNYYSKIVEYYFGEYVNSHQLSLGREDFEKLLKQCLFTIGDNTYYFVCPKGTTQNLTTAERQTVEIIKYVYNQIQERLGESSAYYKNQGFKKGKNSVLSFFDIHFDNSDEEFRNDEKFGFKRAQQTADSKSVVPATNDSDESSVAFATTNAPTCEQPPITSAFLRYLLLSYRNRAFLNAGYLDEHLHVATVHDIRKMYLGNEYDVSGAFDLGIFENWSNYEKIAIAMFKTDKEGTRWYSSPEITTKDACKEFVWRLCTLHGQKNIVITESGQKELVWLLTQIVNHLKSIGEPQRS